MNHTQSRSISRYARSQAVALLLLSVVISGCWSIQKPPLIATSIKPTEEAATSAPVVTATPVPSATAAATSLWSGGTETWVAPAVSGTQVARARFEPEDCVCEAFTLPPEPSYGPGYLECTSRWNGTYIDDNHMTYTVTQFYDKAELEQVFNEEVGWKRDTAQEDQSFIDTGSSPDAALLVLQDDADGFVYITTQPGGGSSKTGGEIPMCGNGGGMLVVNGEYLVELRLFACDMGDERPVYETAIQTLNDCALDSIVKAKSRAP